MKKYDLDTNTLVLAYSNGYFPMPHPETEEICWFHPDTRAVMPLDSMHVSRSLRRRIKKSDYQVTIDKSFAEVMKACADRKDTWINAEFLRAYNELHLLGLAHSLEIWHGGLLTGGIYGVSLGGAFFAESKFHRQTDASKLALYHLVEQLKRDNFELLEVQFITPHLRSLGVIEVSSEDYQTRLAVSIRKECRFGKSHASNS